MDKHKPSDNKSLIIILCVLVVMIIGLVAAIVAVSLSGQNHSGSGGGSISNGNSQGNSGENGTNNGGEGSDNTDNGGGGSGTINDDSVPTVGTSEPLISDTEELPIDLEQEQIQKQIKKTAEMQNYVQNISRDDAIKYINEQINGADNPNDKFNAQIFKLNLYTNAGDFDGALKVGIAEIGDISNLILWNQKSYYDAMANVYSYLDDQDNVKKYRQLSQEIYDTLFDGGEGFYE